MPDFSNQVNDYLGLAKDFQKNSKKKLIWLTTSNIPNPNCRNVSKQGILLDNRWVVSYNTYLSTKYNAHINVEICNTIGAVKYLFKYVYKGSDKATFSFEQPDLDTNQQQKGSTNDGIQTNKKLDEIKKFLDARYVSASEAIWRIFGFITNAQNPHTYRLPIHLPDQQQFFFLEIKRKKTLQI